MCFRTISQRDWLALVRREDVFNTWRKLEQVQPKSSSREDVKEKKILLWHCWLGHPSFAYLEYLFPKLFCDILFLAYDVSNAFMLKSSCSYSMKVQILLNDIYTWCFESFFYPFCFRSEILYFFMMISLG